MSLMTSIAGCRTLLIALVDDEKRNAMRGGVSVLYGRCVRRTLVEHEIGQCSRAATAKTQGGLWNVGHLSPLTSAPGRNHDPNPKPIPSDVHEAFQAKTKAETVM